MSRNNPGVSRLAAELSDAAERMTQQRRAFLDQVVAKHFPPDVEQLIEELTPLPSSQHERDFVVGIRQAIKAGFVMALARYGRELRSNAEAMAIIGGRKKGGDKGRASQTAARQKRAPQARALLDAGHDVPDIATRLGRSISTVYRDLGITPKKRATPTRPRRKR